MKNVVLSISLCILVFTSPPVSAATKDGVTMPDTIRSTSGKNLILNGLGTRKATIFGFRVYVGGLYLTHKDSNSEIILNSDGEKQIHLKFLRDVNAADVREAWEVGFHNNNSDAQRYQNDLNALLDSTEDAKTDQTLVIVVTDHGLSIQYPSGSELKSSNSEFGKALLRVWIGDSPPNQELKDGMLGRG